MLQSKLNELHLGLSITSRGVFKFQRIDRIEAPFRVHNDYYNPCITDDADWAVMWFIHDTPFHEADGSDHYPEKLKVYSDILNIEHILDKDTILKIWDEYAFENKSILHNILRRIDNEFFK